MASSHLRRIAREVQILEQVPRLQVLDAMLKRVQINKVYSEIQFL